MAKRVNMNVFNKRINKAMKVKAPVMKQAYVYFKNITPVDTGNARKNTRLINNVIYANYMYAWVLDQGRHNTSKGMRGSKQAPKGMSKPTIAKFGTWIKKYIKGV